jgi:hypothetical protein
MLDEGCPIDERKDGVGEKKGEEGDSYLGI